MSKATVVLLTSVFFAWGFITSLNSVLVPHLKEVFALGYASSALVPLAFFSAYLVVSLPSGALLTRLGYQRSIALGLVISALGALLFYPAASSLSYPLFLTGLFIIAAGFTLLQVAGNPYVIALGPRDTAASRLNLAQAVNALGTTVAPYVGGLLFLSGTPHRPRAEAARALVVPYTAFAVMLTALAAAIRFARMPSITAGECGGSFLAALRVRRVWRGVIAGFLYVGAETTVGSFLLDLLMQPDVAGLRSRAAATTVSIYWGGSMIGRFAGGVALRGRDAGTGLATCAVAAALLVGAAGISRGLLAAVALTAIGLFNSIMFPTIFSLAIDGLGELTSRGSSLLVMSIVGGAALPPLVGAVADRVGLLSAFAVIVPCYLYIAWYGYWGGDNKNRVPRTRSARHDERSDGP